MPFSFLPHLQWFQNKINYICSLKRAENITKHSSCTKYKPALAKNGLIQLNSRILQIGKLSSNLDISCGKYKPANHFVPCMSFIVVGGREIEKS